MTSWTPNLKKQGLSESPNGVPSNSKITSRTVKSNDYGAYFNEADMNLASVCGLSSAERRSVGSSLSIWVNSARLRSLEFSFCELNTTNILGISLASWRRTSGSWFFQKTIFSSKNFFLEAVNCFVGSPFLCNRYEAGSLFCCCCDAGASCWNSWRLNLLERDAGSKCVITAKASC